jgi:hypothetical protein
MKIRSKTCFLCQKTKPLREFHVNSCNKIDGRDARCKECRRLLNQRPEKSEALKIYYKQRSQYPEVKAAHQAYSRSLPRRYASARSASRIRGYVFKLTFEQYKLLISKPCYYCGGTLPEVGSGLDRVNNKKGYSVGNCVSCCTTCNKMKLKLPILDWMSHMEKILKYRGIK